MKSTGAKQSKNAVKRDVLGNLSMKRLKPIETLILTIRGRKVLIDADLASIYEVETRTLNQAVKRNVDRFPEDFIFNSRPKRNLR